MDVKTKITNLVKGYVTVRSALSTVLPAVELKGEGQTHTFATLKEYAPYKSTCEALRATKVISVETVQPPPPQPALKDPPPPPPPPVNTDPVITLDPPPAGDDAKKKKKSEA